MNTLTLGGGARLDDVCCKLRIEGWFGLMSEAMTTSRAMTIDSR